MMQFLLRRPPNTHPQWVPRPVFLPCLPASFGNSPTSSRAASPFIQPEAMSSPSLLRTPSPHASLNFSDSDVARTSSPQPNSDESSISEVMAKIKQRPRRKLQKRILSSPPTSPEKKKAKLAGKSDEGTLASSIRTGMEQEKGGLLRFFNKLATEEDKKMTIALWREGRKDTFTQGQGFGQASDAVNEAKKQHKTELARARKQKQRGNTQKIEIAQGERSPGGTKKRKVNSGDSAMRSAQLLFRRFSLTSKIARTNDSKVLLLRQLVPTEPPLAMLVISRN